jgi:hypothetical protein
MLPSPVTNLMPFVPAWDPELARQFYLDLGFTMNWSNEQIAELQIGSFRFLLQTFYVAEHAGNFQLCNESAPVSNPSPIGIKLHVPGIRR